MIRESNSLLNLFSQSLCIVWPNGAQHFDCIVLIDTFYNASWENLLVRY